jgi:PAS domain S-box-containing protein
MHDPRSREMLLAEINELRLKNARLEEMSRSQLEELRKAKHAMGCYSPLIEQPYEGIYVIFDHKFEFVSETFEYMLGYKSEEVCSPDFDFLNIVAPGSRSFVEKKFKQGYRGEFKIQQFEFAALRKDRHKIKCQTTTIFIPYKWGLAIHGILDDLSMKKHINQEIHKTEESLQIALNAIQSGNGGKTASFI